MAEMENYIGLLKVRVNEGFNLVKKDLISSDPYVLIKLGQQRVKTKTIKRSLDPVWNDELTIGVPSKTPRLEVEVMDEDTFTSDEPLGNIKVDIVPLMNYATKYQFQKLENGKKEVGKLTTSQTNGFVKDSCIFMENGQIKQELHLKLDNAPSGEVTIDLIWIYV
ncbi:hypothetical protein SUGI_0983640 [Cryptomeria japonica]|nr:hypothetical protein SUGI_0983640 [Cryptomeria japonica]